MKEIELTPKAEEDLEAIWDYSFRQFVVVHADAYIGRLAVFDVLAMHDIGTHRTELGDNICSLPVDQHIIYFVSSHSVVTIIRILSQSQDTARHEPWRYPGSPLKPPKIQYFCQSPLDSRFA